MKLKTINEYRAIQEPQMGGYGICPTCRAPVVSRTRGGPNAKDTCSKGHVYPSGNTIREEKEKPFRNRVEVFAVQDGKLYCGEYKDGSLGVFGGGTDGESLEDTAEREFQEETGYKVRKLQKLPIDPIEVTWGEPKSDKQKERAEKYKGTKTWYFWGEFDDSGDKEKAKGEDGEHGLKNVSLKEIDDDLINKFNTKTDDDGIARQQKARTKAIKHILDQIEK